MEAKISLSLLLAWKQISSHYDSGYESLHNPKTLLSVTSGIVIFEIFHGYETRNHFYAMNIACKKFRGRLIHCKLFFNEIIVFTEINTFIY